MGLDRDAAERGIAPPKTPLIATLRAAFAGLESALALAILATMAVVPLLEVVAREWLGGGIPGSIPLVQHLTLWISFLGAALAARSGKLLALSTAAFLPERWRPLIRSGCAAVGVAITALLCAAGLQLVAVDRAYGDIAALGIPIWVFTAIMPIGFALLVLRLVLHVGATVRERIGIALGAVLAIAWVISPLPSAAIFWPAAIAITLAAVLGMAIYAALGGAALLLFFAEGTPISAVPGEAYRMATSPMLPAIPLFTLAGYILAEGGASKRLLRLCAALVGWLPGGLALVVTLVLAFFTPLTGASGITILAMGGLLLPMLVNSRYRERDALGLVTVSGSIGVLFPPSLPVILYAYYAELDLDALFRAGATPGVLLVLAVGAYAAWRGVRGGAERSRFDAREALAALWHAKWEVLLPVVILAGLFGGFATLVETAALTVLYAVVLEKALFRELAWSALRRVALESATLIGGFMIILSVALGLTNYLIIAQVPMHVLDWVQSFIESPYLFLLMLNALLIVVGAAMDIYSAIIVLVPLIAPLASAYGIHPVHLGVVFLANMQLGYLMPPMGENLFLSAYRFDKTLGELYGDVLPYVGILLAVVLLITYVPALTLWALG
jgi:tripartite ATP-independent transporter DctM subunit